MERNKPLFSEDPEWFQFSADVRSLYEKFVAKVKLPIQRQVPEVSFTVNGGDINFHLDLEHFNILVYGDLKSGKSTLLTALIDPTLPLPSDAPPCTSVQCTIKYGEKRRAVFTRALDGEGINVDLENSNSDEERMNKMKEMMEQGITARNKQSLWRSAEIYWPSEILKKGYTFIDTPGLGENDLNDDVTARALSEAHLLLVAIGSPLRKQNKENLARLHGYKDMFFVATKLDTIKELPGASTPKEQARKQVRDRYLLSIKTELVDALPDFKERLNDSNFHAVSALKIVAKKKDDEMERRFFDLQSNINSDIRKRAADAAISQLERLLSDAQKWSQDGKITLGEQKDKKEGKKKTLQEQMTAIREEYELVKKKFDSLIDNVGQNIEHSLRSILDNKPLEALADEAMKSFHYSQTAYLKEWTNSENERKAYEEKMRNEVPKIFQTAVENFWRLQTPDLNAIIKDALTRCTYIMKKLVKLVTNLDKSLAQDVQMNTSTEIKFEEWGNFVTPTAIGPFVARAFLSRPVFASLGLAANFGMGAAIVLAVAFGAFFTYKYFSPYNEENQYDKSTEEMRKKMRAALQKCIDDNKAVWIQEYSKAGRESIRQAIDSPKRQIAKEIKDREEKVKKLMGLVASLEVQEKVMDAVSPAIRELQEQLKALKSRNTFSTKVPNGSHI